VNPMALTLPWWALLSLGVALMITELFIGAFIILWFGIGAILAGILTLVIPDMNLGIQILLTSLIGVVLMYFFRDRYVAKQNASEEKLGTFQATEGRLHIKGDKGLFVFANGTYWQIANPQELPDGQRHEGAIVSVAEFRNNRAYLRKAGTGCPGQTGCV